MRKQIRKGTKVSWNWGNGTAQGVVKSRYTETVTKTIKGSKVKREADKENPAYLIEQEDGSKVLKSRSELSAD